MVHASCFAMFLISAHKSRGSPAQNTEIPNEAPLLASPAQMDGVSPKMTVRQRWYAP